MIGKNIRTIRSVGFKVLFLAIVYFGSAHTGFAQTKYISKYKRTADSLSSVYGIPASVILGVAAIESGNGQSRNSKLLHNHFGIVGPNNLKKTHGIKSSYRQYSSSLSSFVHFCQIVSNKYFYNKLKGSRDIGGWVEAISKSGYSTDPKIWKTRILNTIAQNHL